MKIPRAETILKFLLAKNWIIEAKKEPFFLMAPPKGMKFGHANFRYRVPINEEYENYVDYVYSLVNSISELYGIDKWYLTDMLSRNMEEIKEDIALKSAIIAA